MSATTRFALEPEDNQRLVNLCGPLNANLQQVEQRLAVRVANRGSQFEITGESDEIAAAAKVITELYSYAGKRAITPEQVHLEVQNSQASDSAIKSGGRAERKPRDTDGRSKPLADDAAALAAEGAEASKGEIVIRTRRGTVRGRGDNQRAYLAKILNHDINFGLGPAGTGKTYLAVACAVDALERDLVRKLILVRPAVEAGERLGFLPGDLSQKIDPYLRPLYDALYEMMGFERVERLQERGIIEVAPLAYMRGRTLNEAFVILDEAQNTTAEQMKMFLTRIGFGSRAVITGDMTQVDLPRGQEPGLRQALRVLRKVKGLSFTEFEAEDVVRHPLVQRIVRAYESADAAQ